MSSRSNAPLAPATMFAETLRSRTWSNPWLESMACTMASSNVSSQEREVVLWCSTMVKTLPRNELKYSTVYNTDNASMPAYLTLGLFWWYSSQGHVFDISCTNTVLMIIWSPLLNNRSPLTSHVSQSRRIVSSSQTSLLPCLAILWRHSSHVGIVLRLHRYLLHLPQGHKRVQPCLNLMFECIDMC